MEVHPNKSVSRNLIELRLSHIREENMKIARRHGPVIEEWSRLMFNAGIEAYVSAFNEYVELLQREEK
jgi:hypothetical protein